MIVYLDMRTGHEEYGNATDHRGQVIGTWQQTSTWEICSHQGMLNTDMHAVQVAMHDGTEWIGRSGITHPYRVRVRRKAGVDSQS